MKILVVVSHADDEVLGCGGVIALHRKYYQEDAITIKAFSKGRDDPIDQRFDSLPLKDIISWVEKTVRRLKPDVIYTHSASDLNRDHRIINEAVQVAIRYNKEVKEAYGFAVSFLGSGFNPQIFVDITEVMDDKLRMLEQYKDEIKEYPHYRSPEKIKGLAETWGSMINVAYAEAFEVIRMVR